MSTTLFSTLAISVNTTFHHSSLKDGDTDPSVVIWSVRPCYRSCTLPEVGLPMVTVARGDPERWTETSHHTLTPEEDQEGWWVCECVGGPVTG